ncbi:hypothetical protein M0R45_029999 [Rubus argutus]|uniref:Uncharacterized protein n=1 Tax=Rubus argutus TaxID=59490 RepID=A0AAW1WBU7_RUBAR
MRSKSKLESDGWDSTHSIVVRNRLGPLPMLSLNKRLQDCDFSLWMLYAFPFHILRKHNSDQLFYMNFDASHSNECCV